MYAWLQSSIYDLEAPFDCKDSLNIAIIFFWWTCAICSPFLIDFELLFHVKLSIIKVH